MLVAWTGEARAHFLPVIYVDAVHAAGFALSALVGRPVVGHVYAALFRVGRTRQADRRLRRVLTVATFGWSAVFAVLCLASRSLPPSGACVTMS